MKRLFQRRFSMVETVGLLVVAVLSVSALGYAVSIPNTFTSGTTISSSEVNANLAALADAINKKESGCFGNSANDVMVTVGSLCVDKYEVSVWSNSDGTGTQYGVASDDYPCLDNGNNCSGPDAIYAVSRSGVTPSRYITWFQAQQACALSGKELLTNAEWQMAAAGTPDPGDSGNGTSTCNTATSGVVATGSTGDDATGCVSNWGVRDMVGNASEWVADWTQGNGTAGNNWAPGTGFTNSGYGDDQIFGINPAQFQGGGLGFPAALLRGGDFGTGTPSPEGVFFLSAGLGPAMSGGNIGFRCAR